MSTHKLSGKIAVVTGAGRGIGKAIAERFLDDDILGLALLDLDEKSLAAVKAEAGEKQGRVLILPCDVSDRDQVRDTVAKIIAHFGRIDILVNNAGITRDCMFHKMTDDAWDMVLKVNLNSMYNTCKAIVPGMREQGYGKIVNLSSTSAFGNVGQSNYAASKAAAIGFTTTLARECGAKNITANCVAPGYIQTDMFAAVPESVQEEYRKGIPMNRFGAPSEVASVVSFLSSDDSSFLSGQCIVVNGARMT